MNSLITMQPYFVFGTDRFIQRKYFSEGISHLYTFKVNSQDRHDYMIIPDGCVNLLFGYDDDGMDAKLYGTVNRAQLFRPDREEYFGIRLYQEEFLTLLECTPDELLNGTADIKAVRYMKDYEQQLSEARSFEERTGIFLRFSHEAFRRASDHRDEIIKAVKERIIERSGNDSVSELAQYFSYSARYLNRLFQEKLGLSVKEFSEIVRLQHMLFRIKNNDFTTLTELAMDEGYYDQAHFTNKFREYVHISPMAYRRKVSDTGFRQKIVTVAGA